MELSLQKKDLITRQIENIQRGVYRGPKSEVKLFRDRLNFACPYCGDSSNEYKKRANIYWKSLQFHCYNDGCSKKHTNLVQFLKDFDNPVKNVQDLSFYLDYIQKNRVTVVDKDYLQVSVFKNLDDYSIPLEKIKQHMRLQNPRENRKCMAYLKSRFMHLKLEHFMFDPKENQLYIFNLTPDKQRVIGWQIRNFNRYREKYISYNIEKINNIILDRDINLPDDDIAKANTLSLYFGVMHVDFTRDVTIFEGPIDALLCRNSIAITGADKPTAMFDDIITIRYLFDNDIAGKRVMERKLRSKKNVFMWNKLVRDFKVREKVKDFNELAEYCWRTQNIAIKHYNEYFTNDPLDIRLV